jgi:hypothetical protein
MKRLCVLGLALLCLLAACGGPGERTTVPKPPAIRPLEVTYRAAALDAVEDAEPWGWYWVDPDTVYADLTHSPGLAWSLVVGESTAFPGGLPEGYDLQALVEWGKDPGLNVDILHAHGFTGRGAVVAYIDMPALPHPEYDRESIHRNYTGDYPLSMHGPGVLSLLAGEHIGVAPEAEVWFFGVDSGVGDAQLREADALYRVIALNETLPEGEKITMVGFSDNIDTREAYTAEFRAAVKACEEAGIMVWFCWEYGAATFLPFADKNNPFNLMVDQWGGGLPSLVYVPSSGRTVAAQLGGAQYIYWSTAGLSWTMPYVMGLYAIALSIDPTLTKDELRMMLKMSAYPFGDGLQMVSPIGFVASVLEQAGRTEEAGVLRAEYRTQQNVLCAVVDTDAMTPEDLQAVYDGLAWITDAMVLVMDASCFGGGSALYDTIGSLSGSGLTLAGIQLFGDVPGPENDTLPVWRLDLEPGEYAAFFQEYLEAVRNGEPDTLEEGVLFPLNRGAMVLSEAEGKLEY